MNIQPDIKDYPKNFQKLIGRELQLKDKNGIREGVCDKIRWSTGVIVDLKNPEETAKKAIDIRLKPKKGRAFWTRGFPTDIPAQL